MSVVTVATSDPRTVDFADLEERDDGRIAGVREAMSTVKTIGLATVKTFGMALLGVREPGDVLRLGPSGSVVVEMTEQLGFLRPGA